MPKISAFRNYFVVLLTNLFLASSRTPERDHIFLLVKNKSGIVWLVDMAASEKIFAHIVLVRKRHVNFVNRES